MSSPLEYVPVYTAQGQLAGEMIRLLLESMQIPAIISQESAGATYGLTVGPLGEVKILVPADRAQDAAEVLAAMEAGELDASLYEGEYPDENEVKENKLPGDESLKDWE